MSKERILDDITRKTGMLSNKAVYFGDVVTDKLNGIPIANIKSEGNDALAPVSFSEVYNVATHARSIDAEENKQKHDYEYSKRAMGNNGKESSGLPGTSNNPFFKNSAIGSRKGGVFGNKVSVMSGYTNEESEVNPFAVSTNTIVTDCIKKRGFDEDDQKEPSDKKIKMLDGLSLAKDKKITFEDNKASKLTTIEQGKIVTSEIGDSDHKLGIHASEIEVDTDIVMGNTNKIVTSQISSDDYGTLELKASHIRFTANDISFDPDTTEITTGNFPQVISNLNDYEKIQETVVCTYTDPKLKTKQSNSILNALWRLQIFYNTLIAKLSFDPWTDENAYKSKIPQEDDAAPVKELFINFPGEYYSHFTDYYGKDDLDHYVTSTELLLYKGEELHKKNISIYFNSSRGAFLIMKMFSAMGEWEKWPKDFGEYEKMAIGSTQFTFCVKAPRLKRKYAGSTPSTFMNKPDYFETATPKLRTMIKKDASSDIYKENKTQQLMLDADTPSPYKLQAVVSAVKIQKLAFFDIRYSFIDENTNDFVPFNDALDVIKKYSKNPKEFLITFIPNGEGAKFICADTTNSRHIIDNQPNGVKFIYNPRSPVGLYQGIIDFTDAKAVNPQDTTININFFYVTEK